MKVDLIKIKKIFFIILLFCLYQIAAQDKTDDPGNLLDFWVGEWVATWDEGNGTVGRGINKVQKILDKKVIQENFEITEGQSSGYKGTSISTYHIKAKKWFQSYADNKGTYYHFVGSLADDKKVFKTAVFKTDDGKEFIQRMVFRDITENTMTWDWESSTDGGENWVLNWRIDYKRKF